MNQIFKCIIGYFNIKDAFCAIDLVQDQSIMSVSCVEQKENWILEVLSEKRLSAADIQDVLDTYNVSIIENGVLEDENWLEKCFENFKPITIGAFYVYGPHLRGRSRSADRMKIEIAAATAFGTGEHATTNRCLVACETFFDVKKYNKVLDLGCGSCILSIALAKLGATNIFAYDNDPEAVRISRENIVINKVNSRVKVYQNTHCEFAETTYDFIVANILAEPLISMSESIVSALAPNGLLILSGFTSDDPSVEKKFVSLGLSVKHKYDYKGWTTLVLERA